MKFLRKLLAKCGLAIATVLPPPARPAIAAPVEAPPVVDPANYFHLEVHVGAHQSTQRPVTRAEVEEGWKLAEAHWGAHYEGLAEQLWAHTNRVHEKKCQNA